MSLVLILCTLEHLFTRLFLRHLHITSLSLQTIGTSLNDANHQKDKAKRMIVSLTTALDEQHNKVKIVTEMMVLF